MAVTNDDVRIKEALKYLTQGIPLHGPFTPLERDPSVPHAPVKPQILSQQERELALKNALRYFPIELHSELALEFAKELAVYGHIYMYRFRPTAYSMKAYPISWYPGAHW